VGGLKEFQTKGKLGEKQILSVIKRVYGRIKYIGRDKEFEECKRSSRRI